MIMTTKTGVMRHRQRCDMDHMDHMDHMRNPNLGPV
jgi:hypothetical protein